MILHSSSSSALYLCNSAAGVVRIARGGCCASPDRNWGKPLLGFVFGLPCPAPCLEDPLEIGAGVRQEDTDVLCAFRAYGLVLELWPLVLHRVPPQEEALGA